MSIPYLVPRPVIETMEQAMDVAARDLLRGMGHLPPEHDLPLFDQPGWHRSCIAAEIGAALRVLHDAGLLGPASIPPSLLVITEIGGRCPVQAEGTICGVPFYFRARGESWSIGIGGEVVLLPAWEHEEDYGDEPFAAGYMPEEEALAFIEREARRYAQEMRVPVIYEVRREDRFDAMEAGDE